MKRDWGRLLWVTITNGTVFAFSLYVVIGIYRDDIRLNIDHPPPPAFWAIFSDNPYFGLSLMFAGVGILLEAIKRREAGFINCGFWLAVSIDALAHSQPAIASVAAIGILVSDAIWYAVSARRGSGISARLGNPS